MNTHRTRVRNDEVRTKPDDLLIVPMMELCAQKLQSSDAKLQISWLDARCSEGQDRDARPREHRQEHPWLPIVSLRMFLSTKISRAH
jgi:hypothetical protein